MKSKFIFLILAFLIGCTLFPYDDFRYSPTGLNATVLISYEMVSYSNTEVIYNVKLASFSYYNDVYYDAAAYQLDGDGTFKVLQIDGMETVTVVASSNVLLIDQSGSYTEVDPHNLRTKIINKFLEDLSPPNNHLLGAFSSQGLLATQPVEYASTGFNSEWTDQDFLFDLPKQTGGSSSLYDAINSAIDKLSAGTEPNKNIIVLTHAPDGGSTTSLPALVENAVNNSIKIFIITLGPEPAPSTLWDLNNETQGIVAHCPEDLHLVTVLNHLNRLIKGTVYTSKLKISFKPNSGDVQPGSVFENQIKIADQYAGYDLNPVYVKIKIP